MDCATATQVVAGCGPQVLVKRGIVNRSVNVMELVQPELVTGRETDRQADRDRERETILVTNN